MDRIEANNASSQREQEEADRREEERGREHRGEAREGLDGERRRRGLRRAPERRHEGVAYSAPTLKK